MSNRLRNALALALCVGSLCLLKSAESRADDYLSRHWQWYDLAYRPYLGKYYREWQPSGLNSRSAPYPGEHPYYRFGPSGGRVYTAPSVVQRSERVRWW
jgi:hypothetical protein